MTFDPFHPSPVPSLPNCAWPTINQLAAIGSVVAAWSWLDVALQSLLARLIQADDMLAQALTEDLSPDNRLKALRRIASTWAKVVPLNEEQGALIQEIREIVKWVAKNKAARNEVAHWTWTRETDERMFGWKHHQSPEDGAGRPSRYATVEEFLNFSREIGAMVGRIETADRQARTLPPWPPIPSPDTSLPLAIASLIGPYTRRGAP